MNLKSRLRTRMHLMTDAHVGDASTMALCMIGPPTASSPQGARVYRECPARTHPCATESRMTLQQSANPVRAVGVCSYIQVSKLMLCIEHIRRFPVFDLFLNQLLALQSLQKD